ncbi:MAG: right-handed parallel beta-helix repeat-containing protein [Bryobacteraceae bacterium]
MSVLCRRSLLSLPLAAPLTAQLSTGDPAAVAEVQAGKRAAANASWWGFDPADSTRFLQSAFDSKARTVIVPYMGSPWIVTPLQLRGNQEVVFEPGVVVLAKKGEFRGGGDSLTLRAYGATWRMHKRDYQNPPYQKAEWRMGLALRGVKNVRVEGLRVESSGGDGFYVDGSGPRLWSEDVVIRNCIAHDHHRQGISVISAVNLLVENCRFSGTRGTAPEAGIDLEPDTEVQRLSNITVRDCLFENNAGHAILVYLKPQSRKSAPVSIRFERCLSRMDAGVAGGWSGMSVGTAKDDGPQGLVEFVNCTSEHTGREGAKVYDKSADSVRLRFVNCHWSDVWNTPAPEYGGPRVPVLIQARRDMARKPGGVEFVDCYVNDNTDRPAVQFDDENDYGLFDVKGRIGVRNPRGVWIRLGTKRENVAIEAVSLNASKSG